MTFLCHEPISGILHTSYRLPCIQGELRDTLYSILSHIYTPPPTTTITYQRLRFDKHALAHAVWVMLVSFDISSGKQGRNVTYTPIV